MQYNYYDLSRKHKNINLGLPAGGDLDGDNMMGWKSDSGNGVG